MKTQKEIFDLAIKLNKDRLLSLSDTVKEEDKEILMAIAECYNNSMELIEKLNMDTQQSKIFLDKASQYLYSDKQLMEIAFSICYMYKSEYNIKENANELLDILCDPEKSALRMSQIHIAIVKDLTIDEINEILKAPDEEIVEKTKKIFCNHYNKEYTERKNTQIESPNIEEDFR